MDIRKILREALADFDVAPPKTRLRGNGGGGDNYKIYAYYGDLYLPAKFIRLLNDTHRYPGSEFIKSINGLSDLSLLAIWDSSNYSSNTKGREKFVVDGFYKTLTEMTPAEGREAYLNFIYMKMSQFNSGSTLSDDDILEMLRSTELRFDMTEFDGPGKDKIIDNYF